MSKNQKWTKKVLVQGWMRHNFKGLKGQRRLPSGKLFILLQFFKKEERKSPKLPGRIVKSEQPIKTEGSRTSQTASKPAPAIPQNFKECTRFPHPAKKQITAYKQHRAKGYTIGFQRRACLQSRWTAAKKALVIPQPGHGIPVTA